jgi:hypothetical protein
MPEMSHKVKSKQDVLALMRRLGMTDQLAEAETKLPDPVDVDRDGVLLEELGLSMDLIVDRLGGSAW